MTVGIAALALEGKAIVLMADKLITGRGDLTIEREQVKGAWLPNGWMALYAGGTTFADLVMSHIPAVVEKNTDKIGDEQMLPAAVMGTVHSAYADVWDYVVEHEILRPRNITADQYRAGGIAEPTREQIETEKKKYEDETAPQLLVCGFDTDGNGHIAYVDLREMELVGAFGAIGSGGGVADARLNWQKTRESDELARVVYEVYTAKAHAERNAFVGPSVDAFVMYGNGQDNLRRLSDPTKQLLSRVFRYHDQSPFRIARRGDEKTNEPKPPDVDWERTLIRDILPLPKHLAEIRARILGAGWDAN